MPGTFQRPAPTLKGKLVYVDSEKGKDANSGSIESPIQTIEYGIKLCRFDGGVLTIILRGGFQYVSNAMRFYP